MLSDRDYMHQSHRNGDSINPRKFLWGLIAVNVVVFLFAGDEMVANLALSVSGLKNDCFWQLVSSMFVHGSFSHLLLNMWGLFIFGDVVIRHLGVNRFAWLYLISGVVGNLLWLLCNWNTPAYLLGASGALFGVMLATAMFAPNMQVMLLFFPFPIRMKTMILVYAGLEVFSEFGKTSNIAHLAHLGGIVGAYLFLKIIYGSNIAWDPLQFLHTKISDKTYDSASYRNSSSQNLDAILDKLSKQGPNSLSEEERDFLRQAREKYSKH